MLTIMKRILKLIIFLLFTNFSFSQVGIGLGAIYNLQTESTGFEFRGIIYGDKINIVPQVAYYPNLGINKIHEFYLGVDGEYNFLIKDKARFYGLAHLAYNGWINNHNTSKKENNYNNWCAEAGVGIAGKNCWQPFIEYRYNAKWYEANLRIGIIHKFGCKSNSYKTKYQCPAFK